MSVSSPKTMRRSVATDAATGYLCRSTHQRLTYCHWYRRLSAVTRKTLTMSINPSADAGVSVAMELHGIEDDAVKGKRYRGTAVRKKEAGDLPNLSRNIYAPEARAGQWPKEECD